MLRVQRLQALARDVLGREYEVDALRNVINNELFKLRAENLIPLEALTPLMTIARRVCADHVARLIRDRRTLAVTPVSIEHVNSFAGYVELTANFRDVTPTYREAFLLVAVMGFTYEEAGSILDCPRGTVQSRVARARAQLVLMLNEDTAIDAC
jgi:RNA polymerase sigma-70 factor (ECF subfamily)